MEDRGILNHFKKIEITSKSYNLEDVVRGATIEGSLKLGSTIGQAKVTRLYSIES